MSLQVKFSGTYQSARPHVKVSGTWQAVQKGYVKVSGTWQQFFTAMTVVLSNGGGGGVHGSSASGTIGAATITGGTAPYTYSWAYISGQAVTMGTTTNSSLSPSWTPSSAGTYTSNFAVTVTDANGTVVVSNTASLIWSIS